MYVSQRIDEAITLILATSPADPDLQCHVTTSHAYVTYLLASENLSEGQRVALLEWVVARFRANPCFPVNELRLLHQMLNRYPQVGSSQDRGLVLIGLVVA